MKAILKDIISSALDAAISEGSVKVKPPVILEYPKRPEFGDFSTNLAMLIAKEEGRKPREIASVLIPRISASPVIEKCEVAGAGFINIFLKTFYWHRLLKDILKKGEKFGESDIGKSKKVLIEFVSANPTGPLHIGHARGAAVGATLANILKAAGFEVTREYYINDVGRQIQTLGESVRLRYLELHGEKTAFPEDYYKGIYVKELADEFAKKARKEDPQSYNILAPIKATEAFREFAVNVMLEKIKKDLAEFGVEFDIWQSEKELHDKGLVGDSIEELKKRGYIYDFEGALWFKTTAFGDDKDRVIKKADGELTYFASDIAYHREKIKKGFDTLVNIWGADHHGYEARIRAVLKASGYDDKILKIIFIQLVSLSRAGATVPMGKREGEFVTLKEVMDEVGRDAMRFFFLMRKSDAHLDFDLELAKKQAPENPVYYVQYCHARIMSIIAFAKEKAIMPPDEPSLEILEKLELKEEIDIIKHLSTFEEMIEKTALDMEPHRLTFYLQELAGLFHPYYNRNRVVIDDKELTFARLFLCSAVLHVLKKGLGLLGVLAPLKM